MALDLPGLLPQALVLLAFLAGSAFFSMSETAMIGVDRMRVRQSAEAGSRRARLLDRMLDEPERILSTVLIGNNLVNIGATAFATVVALGIFGPEGAVIATAAMAVLIILFSELLPKTLAVQNPLPVALALARPLRVAEALLRPLVTGAAWISKLAARMLGVRRPGPAPYLTTDEIEMLVRLGVEQGHVEKFEHRVIAELFDFTETPVERIMTPAAKVNSLPKSATLQDAVRLAAREGRSRIVVTDGGFDHVLGFVHIKDLLHYKDEDLDALPVTLALRTCLTAAADTRADRLLVRMQRERRSLAVIQGTDGRNVGIVTADDLVEELVGDIHDEFDAARQGGPPGRDPATVAAAAKP